MCQDFSQDLLEEKKLKAKQEIGNEDYVPQPFFYHYFDSHVWMHVLATIVICALPKKTQICDEKGYDIVPICTIQVISSPKYCTLVSQDEIFIIMISQYMCCLS